MPLFTSTEDFATLAPVLETADWAKLLPTIKAVERRYLRNAVLGATLYAQLHDSYQASNASPATPMPGPMAELLAMCRPAVAGLATHMSISKIGVQLTASGAMVSQTDTMRPAPMWRTRDSEATILEEGLSELDALIDFLLDSADTYNWQQSPFAARAKSCIVRTVKHMDEHFVNIRDSAWTLHVLRPAMLQAQQHLRNVLSDAVFEQLLESVGQSSPSPAYAALILPARAAVIHMALADSAVMRSITLDADGAWTWSGGNNASVSGAKQPATDHRLEQLVLKHRTVANEQLAQLERTAKKLAADGQLPLYADSPQGQRPAQRGNSTPPGSSTYSFL